MNGLTLADINTESIEGKLLIQALIILSTTTYSDKTPDEIIYELKKKHHRQFS